MKLYTEEEVIELMYWISPIYMDRKDIKIFLKNKSTPIELPSDEEIRIKYKDFISHYISHYGKESFFDGAMWLKEQIINQNK